jgi:stage V sporulation protein B
MDQEPEILRDPEATRPSGSSDRRLIVGQTGQNVVGLAIGAVATFVAQVVMANRLGGAVYGIVTVATQFAFIVAAATRFGMDVANVRLVAVLVGRSEAGRARALVRRGVAIAAAVSVPVGVATVFAAPWLAERFFHDDVAASAFRWAGVTIPVAALAFTYMGATRGLKIMRYTLFSQWVTQPIGWIVITLLIWAIVDATAGTTSAAFAASWAAALAVAWFGWFRERAKLPAPADGSGIPEETTPALLRFGAHPARCSRS